MPDKEYLDRARREISEWESAGPGYLAQVGDFVLWPLEKVLDILVPEAIQEAIAKAIEAFLNGLSVASRALINPSEVRSRAETGTSGLGDGNAGQGDGGA